MRVAQGIAGMSVLPLIGLGTYLLIAKAYLSLQTLLIGAAVMLPVDLVLLWLAVRLFSREDIICRWK